eukprot:UN30240
MDVGSAIMSTDDGLQLGFHHPLRICIVFDLQEGVPTKDALVKVGKSLCAKFPRFRSKLVREYNAYYNHFKETEVDYNNHIFDHVVHDDGNVKCEEICQNKLRVDIPLWEMHLIRNEKTGTGK